MIKSLLYFLSLMPFFLIAQESIELSHQAGFYDEPFFLKIKCDENTSISYVTSDSNKSYPFIDSLKIDRNITILFTLHKANNVIQISPKSYFINFITNFNVVSLTLSKTDLFDSIRGLYVDGINWHYDSLYNIKINSNYTKKWERPLYLEMFDSIGDVILSQNAGFRIFGGLTRFYPEKSLRLIARKRYGKSRFSGNIFGLGAKDYKQFVLRHSGNDYKQTRFKDALSTELASEVGLDVQKYAPAHLFVNSEYWGVYNIREKINKYYIDNNHQTGLDDLNIIRGYNYLEEGDLNSFSSLVSFVNNNSFESDSVFNELSSIIDIDQFINYWIYQIYFANIDSRGNVRFWNSDSLGIKFRPILYDIDLGWFRADSNLLKDFTETMQTKWYNPTWRTLFLRKALENNKFKNRFINQITFLMNTHLSSENVVQKINKFSKTYENEMDYHFHNRKRFESYQGSFKQWLRSVYKMKEFALKRDSIMLVHLADKFELTQPYFLDIEVINFNDGIVLLNNNKIPKSHLSGKFFKDFPNLIEVIPNSGYTYFVYDTDSLNSSSSLFKKKKVFFKPNIIPKKVLSFNEIQYNAQSVEIFNYSDTDIVIKDWGIYGTNGMHIIDSVVIPKNRFCILHSHPISDKMDSVVYERIAFNFNRKDKLWLYSSDDMLVDSVNFEFNHGFKSYSSINPFDNQLRGWRYSFYSSIGTHNKSYNERKKMNEIIRNEHIFIYSVLVCFGFVWLFRLKLI